ncbi:MAG: hypothetical protein K2N23_02240 [Clostridia bacterium]|nr:hypothetical protein [Clostridia bacterium]
MKNKFKLISAAFAVGMAVTLAGCGGCSSCSSCNGNSASNTLTRSNWYTGTSYNGIQPSFIEGRDNFSPEIITYNVTHSETAKNPNFSVEYEAGKFITEFYATEYSWKQDGIPAGYANDQVDSEIVYVYKNTLDIRVKYKMKVGDKRESDWFDDHVETVSYFRAAGKNLQPVKSTQTIVSASPANLQPKTLEDAYKEINVSYENFYDYSCTKVFCKTNDNGNKTEKEYGRLDKLSNALFDNSSLYIVARSFLKSSSSVSQSICLFSAAAGGADTYAVEGVDSGLTNTERDNYTEALAKQGLYNRSGDDDRVEATAVKVSYAGGNLQGTAQTIWYAAIPKNSGNNVSRATMLKLSVELSFSLGTLNYSLEEVNSTLWNA